MKEIEGDLIEMAKAGCFDVIAHGCNAFLDFFHYMDYIKYCNVNHVRRDYGNKKVFLLQRRERQK